jgi:hypothetical protein
MRALKLILWTASLAALLTSASAFAQDETSSGGGDGGVVYEEETTYDFEEDVVEGQLIRPDGELLSGQRHGKESSLINIRSDFIPEMIRSAEEL